jgi:hypothetical protein
MCPPGSYAEQAGQSTCTRCAAGRFSSASGSSTAEVCSGCPVGKYVATTGASACYSCPTGNICPVKGLAIYKECLGGTYQDMPGETKCKDCPAGRWQDREGSATCTLCDPGYYNAEQGAAEHSMCYPCEEGKYSLQAGSANCQECGKDTYTNQLGQVQCRPCKVGYTTEGVTTSGLGATRCEMKEQPCPAGYYQIIAADDSITCDICANGTYSTDGSKCTDCKAGSYSSEEGSSFCELCPPGKAGTYSVLRSSFFHFLAVMMSQSLSLLPIYCCLLALSDTTWRLTIIPSLNQSPIVTIRTSLITLQVPRSGPIGAQTVSSARRARTCTERGPRLASTAPPAHAVHQKA